MNILKKLYIAAALMLVCGALFAQAPAELRDGDIRNLQRLTALTDWLYGVPGGNFEKAVFPDVFWSSAATRVSIIPFYNREHLFRTFPFDEGLPERVWGSQKAQNVRWFDKDLNEVAKPEGYGRYTAYVEADIPGGMKKRLFLPIFVYDNADRHWWEKLNVPWRNGSFDPSYPNFAEIDPKAWYDSSSEIRDAYAESVWNWFYSPRGAEMLGVLADGYKPDPKKPRQLDSFDAINADYYLKLKLKVLNLTPKGIKEPAYLEKKAPVLHKGSLKEAGLAGSDLKKLKASLTVWQKAVEYGFQVVMARHGVVVLDEVYPGKRDKELLGFRVNKNSKLEIASLTKLHSGLLLAQFLDQGLINLDDKASRYLPDFPDSGKVITIRMLNNHTTGLSGHGNYNGLANPFLETDEMIGARFLKPGLVSNYNGMGFDLSGRIMEAVSGKSIYRLFHENFFLPLGNKDTYITDMGYGLHCTAMDMARIGQLMLNKGSYGDRRFFSEETFNKLTPIPINTFEPDVQKGADNMWVYGVGMMIGDYGLGPVLTHGSATGSILLVDPERDMVFAMARYDSAGYEHCAEVFKALADMMRDAK
ncbi:MAG: beta-lactamase family protein [Abditibacteriota bacterium]|nr:beta-lactamase family protein [Abditibacteriota bacterium]